jgi:hypothetical protein
LKPFLEKEKTILDDQFMVDISRYKKQYRIGRRFRKIGGKKLLVAYFIFFIFLELMSEHVRIPNACLIPDSITSQTVLTKSSLDKLKNRKSKIK